MKLVVQRFFEQVRLDLRRRETAAAWTAVACWSVLVSALHFGGLAFGIYPAIHWWDMLTHSMSGLGVAAILYLGFCRPTREVGTPWWLFPALLAIGVGFEIYEYLFKSFWWNWTLRYYATDTVIDLFFDVAGAAAVIVAHAARKFWLARKERSIDRVSERPVSEHRSD